MDSRYSRQILVPEVGEQGQELIAKSRVLLVGAGGLGCMVGAQLAGAGVGQIHIVDDDQIELSNLNRQILFRETDIGHGKAETAAKEMQAINSHIEISFNAARLSLNNVAALIESADLVIDAADNFATSYVLSDQCIKENIPLLSASVNRSYGFVGGFCADLEVSRPSFRALFPKLPKQQTSCDLVGVTGPSVGIIASIQAQETLKMLLNDDAALFSKIIYLDLWSYSMHTVDFSGAKEPEDSKVALIQSTELAALDFVVDVRSEQEVAQSPQDFEVNKCLPLDQVLEQPSLLVEEGRQFTRIVTVCRSGQRALIAAQVLSEVGQADVAAVMPDG